MYSPLKDIGEHFERRRVNPSVSRFADRIKPVVTQTNVVTRIGVDHYFGYGRGRGGSRLLGAHSAARDAAFVPKHQLIEGRDLLSVTVVPHCEDF